MDFDDYFRDDNDNDNSNTGDGGELREWIADREKFEDQTERGFAVIAKRLASRSFSGLGVTASGSEFAHALLEETRAIQLRSAERVCEQEGKRVGYEDPARVAASARWVQVSAQLQLPKFFSAQQQALNEERVKLESVLGGIEAKASYAEGAGGTGGNLVPTIVESDVLRIIADHSVVVRRARHVPMSSETLHIPNEATGVTVYWSGEAETLTKGEGTFGVNILEAKKIIGRAAASIEVVEDSAPDLLRYLQGVMAETIGKELDQEALEGDGTNFTGVNAEASVNSVATTTTDGEALTYLDLVNAVYATDDSSIEDGAAWFMHRKIFATVVGLLDSQNRPIFQPAVERGSPGTILGFPVYTTSAIATNVTRGATGSTSNVYFGDPRRLIFGDRRGLRFDVTEQGPGWQFFQVDMRMVGRFGFTVATPGAFSKIVGCTQLA